MSTPPSETIGELEDITNKTDSESTVISTVDPLSSSFEVIESNPAVESTPSVDAVVVEEVEDEDLKFGFKRPEMYKEKFPKSVDPYDRHVFLSYKTALSWPSRVEDVAYEPLTSQFALALKNRKNEIPKKTRFTVIEGGGVEADGDVLIFPEMIKYKNLTHEAVDTFVEDVLVKETTWSLGSPEKLTGFHVFVCAHASRDKRCGVCGPVLIEKLNVEIEVRGLKDQVFVSPCSHVGGHKYAGNVIVFGPNSEEKVMGHWYGYVTPDDVPLLLDQHIGKGEVIEHLWRGEVCQPYEVTKDEPKLKLEESVGLPYLNGTNVEKIDEEFEGSITKGNMQNGGSCCQGVNGFSCCRDDKVESDGNVAENKPGKGTNVCARGLDKMPAWMGRLEQADFLTGVAVIGAVAAVAVAYNIYRRSG